jgi:uroporphyrinogen-III synthase
MDKIKKLLEPLNLLYYEYDITSNTLFADKNALKDNSFQELMKITYTLSKHDIEFFIDENKDIVISYEDRFLIRLKQRFKNIFKGIKNSNKNIYILSDKHIKHSKNIPVIDIKYIKQDVDLKKYDALIFTSKNAVKAIDSMDDSWKKIPSYVIAPQTAKVIKSLGGILQVVGKEHHGDEFASEIIDELQGKKVLYVGGTKIVSNLMNILKDNGIECDDLVVYETICKKYNSKIRLPKNSIIVFSSPSTIECFLKNVDWDESYTAISIGQTTAKFFPEYIKPEIAENTSLESCVKKALELK